VKYEVEVYRDVRETCLVTVEAENEDEADEAAIEASHSMPHSEWRRGHVDIGTFACVKL